MTDTEDNKSLLDGAQWFKASASGANGGCLEVAKLGDHLVGIRDNEDLDNPAFVVTPHVFACFVAGAKAGEFDSLT